MASRATGGTFAAFLISGAILGFAGGALLGTQSDGSGGDNGTPNSSASSPANTGGDAGADGTGDPPPTDPADESGDPTDDATDGSGDDFTLSLNSDQGSVSSNERIDIAGTISPAEEGVTVQLQRSVDGGEFTDFPVGPWETDSNGEFGGYVQSGQSGDNQFRVVLVDEPEVASEPVDVTIG